MTPLFEAAFELQDFFIHQQWQFCIIGGIALLRWGEPRFTRDVDVTLLAGFGRERDFIAPILSSGYRIPDAVEFALRNRVLLLESPQGIPIDIALGALPFEAKMVERASSFEFETGWNSPQPVTVRFAGTLDAPPTVTTTCRTPSAVPAGTW